MTEFNCSLHFMTLKQIGYEELNVAVTSYHDRTHIEMNKKNQYANFTEELSLQQGRKFILHNRLATMPNKISKFKDNIKELDDMFLKLEISSNETNNQSNETDSIKKENLNGFLSCYNSNIVKIIWLSENRLLIVMKNSILIWLIIDTVSGDLILVSIDKSLTLPIHSINNQSTSSSTSSSKQVNLSGKQICDAAMLVRDQKQAISLLILAYLDKSIIDIIAINRNSNFIEYLKDVKSLKKIKEFEPSLKSYEFSIPNQYLIEKRISYHASLTHETNNTFTIWWENSGYHKAIKLENEEKSISLLDRDDLRNNVLILTANLTCSNLLEYLFKSDGNLLACSYLNQSSLIAIEQIETNIINIFRYDLPIDSKTETKNSLKIKLNSLNLKSKIVSNEQIKICQKYILMLSSDQTIIIYEIKRNTFRLFNLANINKSEFNFYNGIEWMIEDLIFSIYNINGDLLLFDIAFNIINLNYMTREVIAFKSISQYLNVNLFIPFENKKSIEKLNEKNCFQRIISSKNIFTDSLWSFICFKNGPIGLFRICLNENFNCIGLINHYLKNSINSTANDYDNDSLNKNLENAVKLLNELDWDNGGLTLICLHKILNFIVSDQVSFDFKTEILGKNTLKCFYSQEKKLNEKSIYENKTQVCNLARRFFYKLLTNNSLHSAYLLATDLGAKDLLNDLYYCALDQGENQIAEISRLRFHELLKKESKTNELEKSLNELDNYLVEDNKERNGCSEDESFNSSDNNYVLSSYNDLESVNKIRSYPINKVYTEDEIDDFEANMVKKLNF